MNNELQKIGTAVLRVLDQFGIGVIVREPIDDEVDEGKESWIVIDTGIVNPILVSDRKQQQVDPTVGYAVGRIHQFHGGSQEPDDYDYVQDYCSENPAFTASYIVNLVLAAKSNGMLNRHYPGVFED